MYHNSHNANPVLTPLFFVSTIDDLDLLCIRHFSDYYIALKDVNMFFFKKFTSTHKKFQKQDNMQ